MPPKLVKATQNALVLLYPFSTANLNLPVLFDSQPFQQQII